MSLIGQSLDNDNAHTLLHFTPDNNPIGVISLFTDEGK